MGYIISTVNMKGGVGKTTLTVNLATCLAKNFNKKVLVLDLDSQISATLSLLAPQEFSKLRKKRKTLAYLIDNIIQPNPYAKLTIEDIITDSICGLANLSLLPGDIELYDEFLVSEMMHQKSVNSDNTDNFDEVWNNFERVLVEQIVRPIAPNYDFIIMDCAPGYNLLTKSAIASSDFYLLPARPEPLSLVGIQLLERRVRNLKKVHAKINPLNLDLLGIVFILSEGGLFGRYDRYYSQVKRRVERDFSSEKMFPTDIPMDVNVAKSLDMFMPVVMSAPNCLASKAFNKLTEEFLQKIAHCKTNNG
ncbi:Chromosome (plasmid) partitioning protein ParA / Sporulation initiation inhibitor protein Soj [Cyanobacterium sp. HL-69]|uniref:ParA family protein n=1 Tax=Cyanobacterium sp. HL-69 TaxID=2054282 RepID=UPI000CA2AFA6|nr:Chromosome (plasmid) partitioning protein ParA / Sporulation initiation inhibitor protein Soj [Cyanobacterium sp. HL-69]